MSGTSVMSESFQPHVASRRLVGSSVEVVVSFAVISYHGWGTNRRVLEVTGSERLFGHRLDEIDRSFERAEASAIGAARVIQDANPDYLDPPRYGTKVVDRASSASRQHFIDTGRYLLVGEAES